jgi:hypothetical protein
VHTDNNPKDIFEVPLDVFTQSNYVNMISAYVAAQETVKGWKSLSKPPDKLLTFIYTGNCANVMTLSPLVDLSVGKAGTAAFVAAAAEAYTEENFRYVPFILQLGTLQKDIFLTDACSKVLLCGPET